MIFMNMSHSCRVISGSPDKSAIVIVYVSDWEKCGSVKHFLFSLFSLQQSPNVGHMLTDISMAVFTLSERNCDYYDTRINTKMKSSLRGKEFLIMWMRPSYALLISFPNLRLPNIRATNGRHTAPRAIGTVVAI